jgi:hypothetical protein
MLFNTLVEIARALNQAGAHWGVGASVLLYYCGLVDEPRDIDILTSEHDVETVAATVSRLGLEKSGEPGDLYSTSHFLEYVVNGTEVDVMAGLAINHTGGTYVLPFSDSSITMRRNVGGVTIPFTSLEDWYVLYQLIPGREEKVKLIEDSMLKSGIADPALLDRALACELPLHVRARIERLMASCCCPRH